MNGTSTGIMLPMLLPCTSGKNHIYIGCWVMTTMKKPQKVLKKVDLLVAIWCSHQVQALCCTDATDGLLVYAQHNQNSY